MLAYLDAFCAALLQRDADVVRTLLQHPLAGALPESVVREAQRVLNDETRSHAAPLQALQLYHQTAHLLGVSHDAASRLAQAQAAPPAGERARQMELQLPARVA